MKLVLVLVAACAPGYTSTATSTFASTYSCPAERQTIVRESPPPDIANDKERATITSTTSRAVATAQRSSVT